MCWLLSVHRAVLVPAREPLLTQRLSLGGSYAVARVYLGRHNAQSIAERHRVTSEMTTEQQDLGLINDRG